MAAVAEALHALADALLIRLDEKGRAYTYDTVNEKRFVPDAEACELCEDAADMDWIPDEATFLGVFGDEDGPPLHPHCGCTLEYRERRVRVYESGRRVTESVRVFRKAVVGYFRIYPLERLKHVWYK